MKPKQVIDALGALAHETRLGAFRLLVEAGPNGLPAGVIAQCLKVSPSSLTFHLQQLVHSGLVSNRRLSRQVIYAMDVATMNDLVGYLTSNCCGGAANERVCQPTTMAKSKRKRSAA